jgi:hypothetical protein
MTKLKPYWFLEDPLDKEHKYYVLMAFLHWVKKNSKRAGFEKRFKGVLTLRKDLDNFIDNNQFSQKTMGNMTEKDKDIFYNLLDFNLDRIDSMLDIVENSIETIDKFLDDNEILLDKYNSLVEVDHHCPSSYNVWNNGYIVIRKENEENLRIYNWFFSTVKISGSESVGLLMSEILEPVCKTTYEIPDIKNFLARNIDDYSKDYDCIIIADVDNKVDIETGADIGKEKSADIIMERFRNN